MSSNIHGNHMLYNQPVVLDNGSSVIKGGFSGENKPKYLEYSIVGKSKYDPMLGGPSSEEQDTLDTNFIGNKAQKSRGLLRLSYPMSHGIVDDWDAMESLWKHCFTERLALTTDFEEHPLLITEAPWNPKKNREQMYEILFEKFGFNAIYVAIPAVLSLYARGETTGCAIDCGDGYSCSVPVYEGFTLQSAIQRVDIGGREVTEQLQAYIRRMDGISLMSTSERELVRTIKEKACYIADDCQLETDQVLLEPEKYDSKFRLPDGKVITLNNGRYKVPEILFRPNLINLDAEGIHEICFNSIKKSDLDLRPRLYSNIVLSGGSTMFRGFGNRLLKELKLLNKDDSHRIRVIASPNRKYSAWLGGSILTGLSTFQRIWLTKDKWEEQSDRIR